MPTWNPRANELFLKALEIRAPGDRQKYLDDACAGDTELRSEVESLLQANARAGGFLESPAAGPLTPNPSPPQGRGEKSPAAGSLTPNPSPPQGRGGNETIAYTVVARFEAERQALALMDHPNIAQVFDGGETASGRPYFVMELVRGIPITDFCDQNQLPVGERLALFVTICQAVQHTHQKRIIHRDLKPSNILVAMHDDKAVVKVIDFGIVKATGPQLTDKTLFTHFAQMIGTPLNMSPEQAQFSGLDVDTRSDIYSLGVLLYELLTGTTPFDKERLRKAAYDEIRRIIREEEPPKPSKRLSTEGPVSASASANRKSDPKRLSQLVRGELDWIVMKALEKDRNRRYETANAFALDVQRYLGGETVLACSPSAGYRLRKFVHRNKRALAMATLLVVTLLAGVIVATVFAFQAKAITEAENATRAQQEAERVLGMQLVSNGVAAMDRGDLSRAAIWFAEAGRRDRSDPERSQQHLLRLRSALRLCARPEHMLFHDGDISFAALSPDGARLVTAGKNAQIWDAHTGAKLGPSMPHDAPILHGKFSKDGRRLLTMTQQGLFGDPTREQFVRVWDVASGRLLTPPLPHVGWVGLGFMLDDECVLTRNGPKTVQLWHTETGKPAGAPFEHPANLGRHLACSPDGQFMATATSPAIGRPAGRFGRPEGAQPNKDDPPSQLWLWNVRTRHAITLPLTSGEIYVGAVFSPDSSRLIYNDPSDVAIVLDVRTGKRLSTYHRHGAGELWHAFAANGRHVFSWSMNRNVPAELWDTETGRAVGAHVEYHNDFDYGRAWAQMGYHAVLSPDGRRVLAPPPDEPTSRVVWDAITGKRLGLPIKHETMITGESFSPDGRLIVAASEDGPVRTWKASRKDRDFNKGFSFAPAGPPMVHDREVSHMRFSPDGRRLVTIAGSVVRIWPLVAEPEPDARLVHPDPVTRVLRTSDGRRAVTATQPTRQSCEIRIWDLPTGKLVGDPRRYADDQSKSSTGFLCNSVQRRIFP